MRRAIVERRKHQIRRRVERRALIELAIPTQTRWNIRSEIRIVIWSRKEGCVRISGAWEAPGPVLCTDLLRRSAQHLERDLTIGLDESYLVSGSLREKEVSIWIVR